MNEVLKPNTEQSKRTGLAKNAGKLILIGAMAFGGTACGAGEKVEAANPNGEPSTAQEETPIELAAENTEETINLADQPTPEIQAGINSSDVHDWLASDPQRLECTMPEPTPGQNLFTLEFDDIDDPSQTIVVGNTIEWVEDGQEYAYSVAVAGDLQGVENTAATYTDKSIADRAAENGGTLSVWITPVPGNTVGAINEQFAQGGAGDALEEVEEQVFHTSELSEGDQKKAADLVCVGYRGAI